MTTHTVPISMPHMYVSVTLALRVATCLLPSPATALISMNANSGPLPTRTVLCTTTPIVRTPWVHSPAYAMKDLKETGPLEVSPRIALMLMNVTLATTAHLITIPIASTGCMDTHVYAMTDLKRFHRWQDLLHFVTIPMNVYPDNIIVQPSRPV